MVISESTFSLGSGLGEIKEICFHDTCSNRDISSKKSKYGKLFKIFYPGTYKCLYNGLRSKNTVNAKKYAFISNSDDCLDGCNKNNENRFKLKFAHSWEKLFRKPGLQEKLECSKKEKLAQIDLYNENFKFHRSILGSGNSKVYVAINKRNNKAYVAKVLNVNICWYVCECPKTGRILPLELAINNFLSGHPSFLKFEGYYDLVNEYISIHEYLGERWVDLFSYIESYGPRNLTESRKIIVSVMNGIKYMHSFGIVHNDIKDENVLINIDTLQTKIIDFGSSAGISDIPCNAYKGTKKFACPQVFTGLPYTDMQQESWAFGCLMYIICFRKDPYEGVVKIVNVPIKTILKVTILKIRCSKYPNFDLDEDIKNAIESLMAYNPSSRIAIQDLQIEENSQEVSAFNHISGTFNTSSYAHNLLTKKVVNVVY